MNGYSVAPAVRDSLDALLTNPSVQAAAAFLKADEQKRLLEQLHLAKIPALSGMEKEKAKEFGRLLSEAGLENISFDAYGNVFAVRRGSGNGPTVVLDAHLDTVFPMDTPLEPRTEGGRIYLPGLTDDTAGLAALLSIARALGHAGIETEGDLVFIGTAEEETGHGGMAGFVKEHRINSCISVDCDGVGYFVYGCMGRRTLELTFAGRNGRAGGGDAPHALYAAAQTAAALARFNLADGTLMNPFSLVCDGAEPGSLCLGAKLTVEVRAVSNAELAALCQRIEQAAKDAVAFENERPIVKPRLPAPPVSAGAGGKKAGAAKEAEQPRVEVSIATTSEIPAAEQDIHNPIIESLYAIYTSMGTEEPRMIEAASSNSAEAILAGAEGITMGAGGKGGGIHTTGEYFEPASMHEGAQAALMLALMLAGIPGATRALAKK